jgi:hypothetical protein
MIVVVVMLISNSEARRCCNITSAANQRNDNLGPRVDGPQRGKPPSGHGPAGRAGCGRLGPLAADSWPRGRSAPNSAPIRKPTHQNAGGCAGQAAHGGAEHCGCRRDQARWMERGGEAGRERETALSGRGGTRHGLSFFVGNERSGRTERTTAAKGGQHCL